MQLPLRHFPLLTHHGCAMQRGGAGNISPLPGSPPPPNAAEAENDIVPDSAIVETPKDQAYHTGVRGLRGLVRDVAHIY